MAQKVYQKLNFDTVEDESNSEMESIDGAPKSVEKEEIQPQESRKENNCKTTETKDPSVVITRDYLGLAQTVGGNHSCLILFVNRSSNVELRDPVIFTKDGYNRIPPDCRIPPSSNAYCAFRKKSLVLKGTSGVISYEYERRNRRSKRFAVMWKIPYRIINREENEVAVKWMDVDLDDTIDSNMHTSLELYQEMAGAEALVKDHQTLRSVAKNGKTLQMVNSENGAELDATFSGSCKAIVKIDFNYTITQTP